MGKSAKEVEEQLELENESEDKIAINEDEGSEPDIEIIDDTPEEDRGREPMPKEIVDDLEQDDLEEYSEKVKKRLSQMKKVWHDERRAKEAAAREKEEALRFARTAMEENKRLKAQYGQGEKLFIEEVSKAAKQAVEVAKRDLRLALEAGDAEATVAAQEALQDAKIKLSRYQDFKPTSLQTEEKGVEDEQRTQPNQPSADPKLAAWQRKNTWFGSDEEMTALALGLHEKLVRSGVDPTSDDYYARIDKTMKKRFPEYFEDEQEETREKPEPKTPSPTRRAASVVAPATRSTAPKQIRLTQTQVALAKRLGLTPEQYAREVIKLERNNG